jgi:hypothetical protein
LLLNLFPFNLLLFILILILFTALIIRVKKLNKRNPVFLMLIGVFLPIFIGWLGILVSQFFELSKSQTYFSIFSLSSVFALVIILLTKKNIFGYRLREITITIPSLGEIQLVPTDDDKRIAWVLFIETITRVSTQPLIFDQGNIDEALNSLHSLFSTIRNILREISPTHGKEVTVEELAINMLNVQLRPFLSKWHPKFQEFRKQSQSSGAEKSPFENDCRKEMEALRINLLEYSKGFGKIAGVENLENYF